VRNIIIISVVTLIVLGIGYFLIVDNDIGKNTNEPMEERGFFNVEPDQYIIQTMIGEEVKTSFQLSAQLGFESDVKFIIKTPLIGVKVDWDQLSYYVDEESGQTATATFNPIEKLSIGQHNVTIVAKSQNTVRTFNMILDVVGKDEVQVNIQAYNYLPMKLTVVQGTSVTWFNKDDVIHSVTSPENIFDMDMQRQEYKTFVFDEVGTFPYFCKPHPYMTGTIIVIPKA